MRIVESKQHQQEAVLTKALSRLAAFYRLSGRELSDILGISESTITRINQGKKYLSLESKEGEMAVILIRIYRSLNAMVGNDHEKARQWLNSDNSYFQNKPIIAMKTIPGLISVLHYLDAMRGKL